jgi:hypothetical protein
MACFGEYLGGLLCVLERGVRINFRLGDSIIFLSGQLEHWVTKRYRLRKYEERFSCVFFTHCCDSLVKVDDLGRAYNY